MKNGTLFLFKVSEDPKKRTLVQKLILYFAGEWVHVAIGCFEHVYEETWPKAMRTPVHSYLAQVKPDEIWEPIEEFEGRRMQIYLETSVNLEWPYNVFKFAAMAVVYGTRWFWKKIKWVPFDRWIFGEICSAFADEALFAEGFDAIPGELQGYSTPGDLRKLPGYRLKK